MHPHLWAPSSPMSPLPPAPSAPYLERSLHTYLDHLQILVQHKVVGEQAVEQRRFRSIRAGRRLPLVRRLALDVPSLFGVGNLPHLCGKSVGQCISNATQGLLMLPNCSIHDSGAMPNPPPTSWSALPSCRPCTDCGVEPYHPHLSLHLIPCLPIPHPPHGLHCRHAAPPPA